MKDRLIKKILLYKNLKLYTGYSDRDIEADLKEKMQILDYLVKQNIETVEGVGKVMAEYYTDKVNLMKFVKSNKPLA